MNRHGQSWANQLTAEYRQSLQTIRESRKAHEWQAKQAAARKDVDSLLREEEIAKALSRMESSCNFAIQQMQRHSAQIHHRPSETKVSKYDPYVLNNIAASYDSYEFLAR